MGDAQAARQAQGMAFALDMQRRLGHGAHHALGQQLGAVQRGLGHEDGELVAPPGG